MSPYLFWGLVIILTLLLGALLPKVIQVVFRLLLYVIAFLLIMWACLKAGLVPESWRERVDQLFQKEVFPTIEMKKEPPVPSREIR